MTGARSTLRVVEEIYRDLDAPSEHWLEGVRKAAGSLIGPDGVAIAEMNVHATGCDVGTIAAPPLLFALHERTLDFFGAKVNGASERDLVGSLVTHFPPAVTRRLYFSGSVSRVSTALRGEGAWAPLWRRLCATTFGMRDAVNAVGLDPSGRGVVLSLAVPAGRHVLAPSGRSLALIAGHLASAARLRRARGAEEAVLERGRVLHAEGEARDEVAREALVRAALDIDRSRRERADLEDAGLWTALVEGQWSLIERFDRDGRRFYVARRNEPPVRAELALGPLERKTVALAGLGRSQKYIAFELGLAEARVSTLLKSTLQKLGLRSRAELVELHGHLVG